MLYAPLAELLANARQQERERQLAHAMLVAEFTAAPNQARSLRWIMGHALVRVGDWITGPHTHEPTPSPQLTTLEPARGDYIR